MDSSTSPRVVLRFLDGDGDPVYIAADAILGISVGLADRVDQETREVVHIRGTILHTAGGPLPVYDDYEEVLLAWMAATGGSLVTGSELDRPLQFVEPAP